MAQMQVMEEAVVVAAEEGQDLTMSLLVASTCEADSPCLAGVSVFSLCGDKSPRPTFLVCLYVSCLLQAFVNSLRPPSLRPPLSQPPCLSQDVSVKLIGCKTELCPFGWHWHRCSLTFVLPIPYRV